MANTVSYRRTKSKNYQSESVEVSLEVLDGWNEMDTLQLCKYLIDASLDFKVNRRSANKLLRSYYDDEDADIEDYALESIHLIPTI